MLCFVTVAPFLIVCRVVINPRTSSDSYPMLRYETGRGTVTKQDVWTTIFFVLSLHVGLGGFNEFTVFFHCTLSQRHEKFVNTR